MRFLWAAAFLFATTGASLAGNWPWQAVKPVRGAVSSGGGEIILTSEEIWKQVQAGNKVRIRGYCASSCTMYLWAEVLECVEPTATLGFHQPWKPRGEAKRKGITRQQMTDLMLWHYPKATADHVSFALEHSWPTNIPARRLAQIDPTIRICDD